MLSVLHQKLPEGKNPALSNDSRHRGFQSQLHIRFIRGKKLISIAGHSSEFLNPDLQEGVLDSLLTTFLGDL